MCVYLTCKTEELRISIITFLDNVYRIYQIDMSPEILLAYELLLIENLKFNLVIHTAYRPFEGLIIDLKVDRRQFLFQNENLTKLWFRHVFFVREFTMQIHFVLPVTNFSKKH